MVRGIRNSFGIAWDPITGNLWDTENGPHFGDEINLVELGFNSGWVKIQGVWKPRFDERGELSLNPTGLVSFGGRGKYNEPQFTWIPTVAPTAMCIRITIHPCRQRIERASCQGGVSCWISRYRYQKSIQM